jgi:hypothetical protein
MRTGCFARSLGVLATATDRLADSLALAYPFKRRSRVLLGCAAWAFLVSGCASSHNTIVRPSDDSAFADSGPSLFGRVAIAQEASPASFGFQKAKGKLGSAKEAFLDSTEMGLSAPGRA